MQVLSCLVLKSKVGSVLIICCYVFIITPSRHIYTKKKPTSVFFISISFMLSVEEMFSWWWKTVLSEYNLIDCYQTQTHPPTCANTHETTCSFTSFLSISSLHRLISSPVCASFLRGGVVDQTPGPGVWAHVFNGAGEGMHCQKVNCCQPAIIHPSLFPLHLSFSLFRSGGPTSVRHYRDGPQNGSLFHSWVFGD